MQILYKKYNTSGMKRYTSDKVFHQRFPLPRLMMFLLLVLFSPLLGAQSTLPVLGIDGNLVYPDEAPEELFSYEIGDAEIDFFLLGSWQANLGFAAGLTWLPQSGGGFEILPYPPSDFASTPLSNEVDLLVSLWIDNQFFSKAVFAQVSATTASSPAIMGRGSCGKRRSEIPISASASIPTSPWPEASPEAPVFQLPWQLHHRFMKLPSVMKPAARSPGHSPGTGKSVRVGSKSTGLSPAGIFCCRTAISIFWKYIWKPTASKMDSKRPAFRTLRANGIAVWPKARTTVSMMTAEN
jgi:hypothetical protein